jgi:RNA polymerase sigma-70 factor (ECF subfamily)
MNGFDENVLIERMAAGDRAAFREFVEIYKRIVYKLAYDLAGNHADAEDISQEVFIKVFRSIRTFKKGSKLNSWLYRVTINAGHDHFRRKPRETRPAGGISLSDERAPDLPTTAWSDRPEKSGDVASLQRRIDSALAGVTSQERAAFVLRHYEELDLKSIAETMEVSVGAVKSYLSRGIRKIRRELADFHSPAPVKVGYE